jgi:hypothetical protein
MAFVSLHHSNILSHPADMTVTLNSRSNYHIRQLCGFILFYTCNCRRNTHFFKEREDTSAPPLRFIEYQTIDDKTLRMTNPMDPCQLPYI